MTNNYSKTNHTLPEDVRVAFIGMPVKDRNAYMLALRSLGWTLQSISEAVDLTRERVRQIVVQSAEIEDSAPVWAPLPEPPERPLSARREPKVYIEPDPEILARMIALKPLAQQVRSNSPRYRAEAEEYTRLISTTHDSGVSLYRLAIHLGVTHGALRFRLARYGYKLPVAGAQSKVYTKILKDNRVTV